MAGVVLVVEEDKGKDEEIDVGDHKNSDQNET